MCGINHLSVYGEPVGMHVHRAHEHRQLYAAAVEIFPLESLFQSHHLTVGRGYDRIFRVAGEMPAWRTEKVDHQQIKHNRRPRQQRDKPWQTAQKNPSRDIDYQQSQQKDYQYVGTFAVNFDSHCSIEIPMKPRACGKKAGKLLKKVGVYQLMLRCSHSVALKYKVSVFFLKPRHFRCQTGIFYRYGFNIRHNPPTGSL